MCAAIAHRGPDDEGVHVDGNFGMGMRRLAIIDLESGHQPIFNEDQSVGVVYNGEIYNYPELRSTLSTEGHRFRTRSDTETLVHGYERWGLDLPSRLNGMFAFCVWDASKRKIFLARDHIGIKPLYVYEDDGLIAWASEIKALLVLPDVPAVLDDGALVDFLTFGYVPGPRTMFRGIRKLLPASTLVIDPTGARSSAFWDLQFNTGGGHAQAWTEEVRALLDDSVRRQLMSDVPLGAFLSGGIDSSSIVATMSRLGVEKISTYAIGFGADDAFHSELPKAASVAKQFGTDHHEIMVEPNVADLFKPLIYHLDEPFTDTSFVVTYLVSRLARETVTVILSGVGGDEIFAGYRRYLWPRYDRLYRMLPGVVDRSVVRPLLHRLPVDRGSRFKSLVRYAKGFVDQVDLPGPERYQGYVRVFSDDQLDAVASPQWRENTRGRQGAHVVRYFAALNGADPLSCMLYADLKTALVDSLLSFTDKMSMAVSLEARVPLLDYRLVELAARIPSDLKIKGLTGLKHVLKEAVRDRLPEHIVTQKKQGFGTPVSRWFRGHLKPMLLDLLSAERIKRRGFFDVKTVGDLVDAHMKERADHSEHLMALVAFEMWHEIFLDGRPG
jgi:asparagine synthase (glutamine-hydrolysing)